PEYQRQVLHFLGCEAAGDAPLALNPRLDARRRLDAAVEDDGELAADVLRRDVAELAPAFVTERKGDGRLVVLVERRPRVAEVVAGDGRGLLHQVVDRAGVARRAGRAGHDFHAGRHLAVG